MDFAGWFDTWRRVLTQPGEPVFEQEKMNPNGTLQTALIWMLIAGVVAGIFGVIAGAIGASSAAAMISQMGLPPEVEAQMGPALSMATGTAGFGAIVWVPVSFLIGTFIIHLIAKMLGGQGDFSRFAYLFSTFQAPLTIISALVSIIPFLGGCISFLVLIYTYVEAYFAVKVNYGLSSGRAIAAILIPLAVLFLLFVCLAVAFAGMIAAISSN